MDNKLLTVIIPNYNNEKYIAECLESIINQTYKLLDIIVVDDGSDDNSLEIIKEYERKDTRIRVVSKTREGAASARAIGAQYAKGEYITFPDGDDWLEPSMYSVMMQKALEEETDVVCNNSYIIENKGKQEIVGQKFDEGKYTGERLSDLQRKIFLIAPSLCLKIYKRECIVQYVCAVDRQTKVSNDMAASYPALMNVKSIYMMNAPMYHYRINHKGPSNLGPVIKINSYALTYCKLADAFDTNMELMKSLDIQIGQRVDQLLRGVLTYRKIKETRKMESVGKMFERFSRGRGIHGIRVEMFRDKKYLKLMLINRFPVLNRV